MGCTLQRVVAHSLLLHCQSEDSKQRGGNGKRVASVLLVPVGSPLQVGCADSGNVAAALATTPMMMREGTRSRAFVEHGTTWLLQTPTSVNSCLLVQLLASRYAKRGWGWLDVAGSFAKAKLWVVRARKQRESPAPMCGIAYCT